VSQRTCLHEAAELGDIELVELLLKGGGADPICRDSNDLTPYDLAYNKKNREVCMHVLLHVYMNVHMYDVICW
jgi:ankyrin repeat protein